LRGPKRAWVGHFTHRAPDHIDVAAVRARYFAEAIEWFDAYLRRDPAALRRVAARPKAVVQQSDGRWRGDTAFPPKDARPAAFALRNGSYYEDPTEDGKHPKPANVLWSIGQRLPYAVHLSGAPRVSLSAVGAGPAQVVVKVYDVAPNGDARMVSRAVHANVQGKVAFDLYPTDWRFRPGHRIAFSVQGNEPFWSLPQQLGGLRPARGENVAVSGAVLSAPMLTRDRRSFLFDKPLDLDPEQTLSAATIQAGATTFRLPPRLR
ncbi:MAG TPA: CocE/NonD family hydrolase C-terminal non-catalytic domain-containing protein, partial [Frankiaceae bacterium]|nr:CocE/NonD family hydrolase C-terminal non-catalytic domain-containing protein [Frankiaceae bacterium]